MNELLDEAGFELHIRPLIDDDWKLSESPTAIEKEYKFKSFIEAFSWMTKCAIWAEKLDHHPEWFNVYNKVKVKLTTHDVGGLSIKDGTLAKKMDSLAE
ncbi:MAG: 4a-hydroxytetrahydrobiopterin dehydratase [Aestuariivita sp.]|nr:4a-hydroxytetrahydrobiopterin dehydratase [Aestuariivita sp.]